MRSTTLAGNLALFVGAVLVVNGLIFTLGMGGAAGLAPDLSGWLVGAVRTTLFAAFGVAQWRLQRRIPPPDRRRFLLPGFAVLCLSYPFYTLGLSDLLVGLLGNVATMLAAIVVIVRLWPVSRSAALLAAPVLPWLVAATWTIVRSLGA